MQFDDAHWQRAGQTGQTVTLCFGDAGDNKQRLLLQAMPLACPAQIDDKTLVTGRWFWRQIPRGQIAFDSDGSTFSVFCFQFLSVDSPDESQRH